MARSWGSWGRASSGLWVRKATSAVSPPTIQSVAPTFGTTAGGTALTINGTFPEAISGVTIGGTACTSVTRVSSSVVTCTSPAKTAGTYDVIVTAAAGSATLTAGFEYTAGGGLPADIIGAWNWSTATGTSSDALLDSGKSLPLDGSFGSRHESLISTGLSAPSGMTNVLRGLYNQPAPSASGVSIGDVTGPTNSTAKWAAPGTGESHFHRMYIRFDVDVATGGNWCHPIEANLDEEWLWGWQQDVSNANAWNLRFKSATSGTIWPDHTWTLGPSDANPTELSKDVWYRLEWQLLRMGTNSYQLHARLYNAAGTLIYDDDDFSNINESRTLAANPSLTILDSAMTSWYIDISSGAGAGWSPVTATEYIYYGGLMLRTADWCGPFSAAEESF